LSQYIKRRLSTVEAVYYSGVVDNGVANILKDKKGLFYFDFNKLYIYNELNKPVLVNEGEMIVLYSNGLLGVLSREEFLKEYKELKHEISEMDLAISTEPSGLFIN